MPLHPLNPFVQPQVIENPNYYTQTPQRQQQSRGSQEPIEIQIARSLLLDNNRPEAHRERLQGMVDSYAETNDPIIARTRITDDRRRREEAKQKVLDREDEIVNNFINDPRNGISNNVEAQMAINAERANRYTAAATPSGPLLAQITAAAESEEVAKAQAAKFYGKLYGELGYTDEDFAGSLVPDKEGGYTLPKQAADALKTRMMIASQAAKQQSVLNPAEEAAAKAEMEKIKRERVNLGKPPVRGDYLTGTKGQAEFDEAVVRYRAANQTLDMQEGELRRRLYGPASWEMAEEDTVQPPEEMPPMPTITPNDIPGSSMTLPLDVTSKADIQSGVSGGTIIPMQTYINTPRGIRVVGFDGLLYDPEKLGL